MTNPTHEHNAQTQNTSSEYLAIDFSHRLPSNFKKDGISFIDAIDHFAYRAIGVLETIQKADFEIHNALSTAISEIEDIRATVLAYTQRMDLPAQQNTNPQT